MKIASNQYLNDRFDINPTQSFDEKQTTETLIVFQCAECGTNYFFPPTRCKQVNCNNIHFKPIIVSGVEKEKIYSGF
ncbi:MAG: hypothetical protein K9W46_07930 [Candidatus Heimdallarchaeum endolithica]|uniref:Uncharacterized protein n=1 Tax=Candidatus Heimdallarchaeum endolithica TaxID=2876572 RepID=A0A9Y1BNJ7_9ARCH|nr:MAG: hypothetical protein K9W46_07930 [Candidatus Heimdallarchaeum endolithica]